MTAKVTTPPNQFKYRAWCNECQDGLNTNARVIAKDWANDHNQAAHKAAYDVKEHSEATIA